MSSEVEVPVSNGDGESDKPLQQENAELELKVDVVKVNLPSPPYNAETNASDSGVSNASSLTSDFTTPLNNGDIHELTKTVYVEPTKGDARSVGAPPSSQQRSHSGSYTELSVRVSSSTSGEAANASLLEVSEIEHGLSMMSLEVMTSGEQLNLMAEGDLGGSEPEGGSVESSRSRSLSPDLNQLELEEKSIESESGLTVTVPPTTETVSEGQSPSDGSRCSSSMGCLEPRPHDEAKGEDPRDVQKKLLESVQTLTSDSSHHINSNRGRDSPLLNSTKSSATPPEQPSQSLSAPPTSSVTRSNSNQSLKSSTSDSNSNSGSSFRRTSLSSFFRRKKMTYVGSADHTSQTLLAATSTTGLILQDRPSTLPAKSAAEERRHQKLYEQMVAAARKKELEKAKQMVKKEEERRSKDKMVADSLKEWSRILPKWDSLHKTRKVRDLWWSGLPPGVRGEVWKKALRNDLNISPDLYLINLRRCRERLQSLDQRGRSDSSASQKSLSREQSVEVIHLDVLRTFPTLGFFQEGGPYHQTLHDVLGAYACYRPDIGYVQGMSFLAAVLLLNMEAADAFISLANLLNRSSYLAFFRVDHTLMRPYFDSFNIFLQESMPKLSAHFEQMQFSPEYYLIEWIFTIYTRTLPLDIACRVWDLFCRDGDSFLFRTALGILRLYQSQLLGFCALEDAGQFLGKLPPDISSDTLFNCIDSVHLTPKRFDQVVQSKMSSPGR